MRAIGKTPLRIAAAAVLALTVSGCAYYDGYYGYGYRYPYYSTYGYYGYYFDGYYDGYYGPYYGGYWATDGYFYYRDRNRRYYRDQYGHFRRGTFEGARPFRSDRYYGRHWRYWSEGATN